MSQENVEIVRGALESAAPLSDYERLAPDAEFTDLPDQRLLQGMEELRAFRDSGPWGRSATLTPERYFDVDDEHVLAFVRIKAVGQRSGTPVDLAFAHEFTLHDGLIVRMKVHLDRDRVLADLGLSDQDDSANSPRSGALD
jgi:ketosteroid isomerase-like protein